MWSVQTDTLSYSVYLYILAQKTSDHMHTPYSYQHLLVNSIFVVIGRKCKEVFKLVSESHCISCHMMSYVVG